MDADKYLQYLRTVHDRLSNAAKRDGITTWALVGAAVYLISRLAEVAPHLINNPDMQWMVGLIFIHLFMSFDFAVMLLKPGGLERRRPSDYRVFLRIDRTELAVPLFQLTWLTLLPAVVSGIVSYSIDGLTQLHIFVLRLNSLILFVLYAIVVAALIFAVKSVARTGLPPLTSLGLQKTRLVAFISWVVSTVIFMLAVANGFGLIETIRRVPKDEATYVLIAGLYAFLLVHALKYLIDSMVQGRPFAQIERLERDILFSNLEESEIRQRIEEEFLGQEVSLVLRQRLANVREHMHALNNLLSEMHHLIDQPSIDEQLISRLTKDFEDMQSAYEKDVNIVLTWLESAFAQSALFDDYVRSLLSESLTTIKESHVGMREKCAAFLEKLRARIEQLGTNRQGQATVSAERQ